MAEKETVIGADTQIIGEVRGEASLVVRGRIEGKISISEALTIAAGAIVQADIDARTIEISGVVVGAITAKESVRLLDKARVVGDVSAPRVGIEAGAQYRGRVEMGEAAHPARQGKSHAVVSRSVAAEVKAPPRMASAASAAAGGVRATPRVASIPVRPTTGVASAPPAWARKKARRR